jgi:CHAT domain-containing protein
MRFSLAIAIVLSINSCVFGQDFNDSIYLDNQALVDSFYAAEDYAKLEKVLERQVNYLIETARYDSLHEFVYKTGRTKTQLGKTDEGIERAEFLVGLIEKEDSDSSNVLFSLNELSWVYYEAGLDSMCMATDLRFLDFCHRYSNADVMERSDAHYNLGFDYQVIGNTPKAIFHFKEAVNIIEEDTTVLLSKKVDCYNALGASYWKYGDMNKAKNALKRSSELALLMKDTTIAKMYASNAIGNLSLAYEDEGNLAKSMDLLEEAIKLRKEAIPHLIETYDKHNQQRNLVSNYHNLAALYLSIGDLERALAMTEYVYSLQTGFFPDDDEKKYVGYEESRGSIKLAAGNYKEAEVHLLNSLEGTVKEYGEVNYHTLNRHQRLGQLYQEWGKYEKALFHINRTIELAAKVSDQFGSQELAKAYRFRAAVRVGLGDYADAHLDLLRSAAIFTENFGDKSNPVGEIQLERAKVFTKQNESDSSEIYLDQALAIFESNRTLNRNKEAGNYRGIVRMLPEALLMKAQFVADSDVKSLEKALEYLESALTYLSEERRNFDSDGAQLSFIDEHAAIYAEAAAIAYQLYALTGKESFRDELLRYAEERKTVLLKRQLNKFSSLRVAQVPDSIIAKERFLLKQLSDPEVKENYGEIEEQYDALLDHIREAYQGYYELRYNSKTASLTAIQNKLLQKEQTLIEYVETSIGLMAFIITPTNIELVTFEMNDIEEKIKAFNNTLINRNQKESRELAEELYTGLFAPLEAHCSGSEIFIIPDGALYSLNFEVLTDDKTGRFLIEDYTISYLLSATTSLLYQNLARDSNRKGILAMAPGFENGENEGGAGQKFIRQPFAMKTAAFIGELFSGQSVIAAQATEDRFKQEAEDYRIIHLGTHTEINTNSPMLSRLILTRSEKEDGYLHAYEIYNLPLRAELAVLTACETGVGKESSSEGVLSMAHGFAYAGCPSLVMSLWEIDEKTSAQIIETFYQNLAEGMAKNEALRKAKLSYLNASEGELNNPYYWSGLVLFGNVEPIESSHDFLWIVLSLIGIAILLILARQIRRKES